MLEKLKSGKVSIGTWITLQDTVISEIFANNSNIDFTCIDLEHSALTTQQVLSHLQVISLCNKTPLVRIADFNAKNIAKYLDFGAKGIIAPMVKNIKDIENLRNSMSYMPKGQRGMALHRAHGFRQGPQFDKYLEETSNELMLIPIIECTESLQNIDEICNSELINAVMIGPYDLSASLGVPGQFEHEKFIKAVEKIEKVANKYSCPTGFHITEPNPKQLKRYIEKNYQLIVYSVDFRILEKGLQEAFV